jgi:acyl-CoA hydrolase
MSRVPAIRVLLLPKDTNAYGTIFGGVILSNIDLASAVEARKLGVHRFVTKAMREVEFHEPVHLGDIVSFYTETVRVGRTSVTVRVTVEAERWGEVPSFGAGLGTPNEGTAAGLSRRSVEGATAGLSRRSVEGATAGLSRQSVEGATAGLSRRSVEGATAGHGETVKVTEAEVVLVALGADGRPTPVRPEHSAPRA